VGDFVWSNARLPYTQSGQWGYLRVLPAGDSRIQPLGVAGMGAKQAEVEPAVKAIPTAMK
jgi:hypothetical protein